MTQSCGYGLHRCRYSPLGPLFSKKSLAASYVRTVGKIASCTVLLGFSSLTPKGNFEGRV